MGMCEHKAEGIHQTGSLKESTYQVCGEPKVKANEELLTDAKKKAAKNEKKIKERRRMRFRRV